LASAEPYPDDWRAWRKAERARLIAARQAMADAPRKAATAAITEQLTARFAPGGFASLGVYWPFRREYDPLPFARAVLAAGGWVALPVVVAPRTPLDFRAWTPETKMEAGVWNIPHPAQGPATAPAAFLAPLVGFDDEGYRLGYGAGYYDRTLAARADRPLVIGVGFELSRLPTIRPQPHDVPMDYILTEAGLTASPAGARRRAA
jgi:5-formyltetrahydrofolate cyclo-ligase